MKLFDTKMKLMARHVGLSLINCSNCQAILLG